MKTKKMRCNVCEENVSNKVTIHKVFPQQHNKQKNAVQNFASLLVWMIAHVYSYKTIYKPVNSLPERKKIDKHQLVTSLFQIMVRVKIK
jgi:hypothetical protein